MNKTFRTIWNETRGCFVVTHEKATSRGKSGGKSTVIAAAVASALSVLAANPVSAAEQCATSTASVSLNDGDSCVVTSSVSIINTGGTAVRVLNGSTLTGFNNAGTISSSSRGIDIDSSTFNLTNSGLIQGETSSRAGIYVSSDTFTGSITNLSGGVIQGYRGVELHEYGTITGSVINAGTIKGLGSAAIYLTTDSLIGGITNSGLIQGDYGIRIRDGSTVSGGIYNTGTISGTARSVDVSASSTLSGITIAGNNTAKFIGEVFAENTPVTVASGATYTMDNGQLFTLTNSSFTNAGTLKIGETSTGTITGNFSNSGTFRPTVQSTAVAGRLTVSGTASITGALFVDVKTSNTLAIGQTIANVVTSTGTLSGNFTSVADNSLMLNFVSRATTGANGHIDLDVIKGITATQAATDTSNSAGNGAAGVIDRLFDNYLANGTTGNAGLDTLLNSVQQLSTAEEVSKAVSQTLPLLVGGSQVAAGAALSGINRVIQARIAANKGLSGGDSFYGDQHFWMKPFGSWADQNDRKGVSGYKANVVGLAFGADATISDKMRVGLAFAYAKADVDGNSRVAPNSAKVDVYQLMGYGSYSLDPTTELSFQAGVGRNNNKGQRNFTTVLINETATADYTSTVATIGAGIGKAMSLANGMGFTPSVRADYTWVKDQGYTEQGSSANLTVQRRTTDELILAVDGKLTYDFRPGTTLTANLGVGYDVLSKQSSITAAFAGSPGASFTTKGLDPDPRLLRAGLGMVHTTAGGTEITLRYDAEARSDFLNQTASVKARWAF